MSKEKKVSVREMSRADLELMSRALETEMAAVRAELREVNHELAYRDNEKVNLRAFENLSDEEVQRLLSKRNTQRIANVGGIKSGEGVG